MKEVGLVVSYPSPTMATALDQTSIVVDHRRAPFLDVLTRFRETRTAPFSTPGHKLGAGTEPAVRAVLGDMVFASDIWLNTGTFTQTLRNAEALAADAWGADRSFYLVNGSSSGNHSFILAQLRPGDEVIIARDIHKSLLSSLILTGARPVYVTPRLHPELNCGLGIAADDVAAALDAHPAAKLVVLVSPSYCGVASDLAGISAEAHLRGIPVYVDEAWGPHFHFHPALPQSAMASGADGAVTSPHKLLSSLSQGSVLHIAGTRIEPNRIAAAVGMTQTTSPLLPILAALDACRRQMAIAGEPLLDRTIELAQQARRQLRELPGLRVMGHDVLGGHDHGFDSTKLVIDVPGLGLTGFEVEHALRHRFGIAPEMSDDASVICLITIGDTSESIRRLISAFSALSAERGAAPGYAASVARRSSGAIIGASPQVLSPRDAYFARSRAVPLADAAGEVAAELVVPYPPGIPVLTPGELITSEKVEYLCAGLRRGMCVRGGMGPQPGTILVVSEPR